MKKQSYFQSCWDLNKIFMHKTLCVLKSYNPLLYLKLTSKISGKPRFTAKIDSVFATWGKHKLNRLVLSSCLSVPLLENQRKTNV